MQTIIAQRSSQIEVRSIFENEPISFCWQKSDRKSKKLDFTFSRNMAHSEEKADADTLDGIGEDLKLLEQELETISRNIQK